MERKSFLIVAKETLANKGLKMTARLLLALLRDYANKRTGRCFPHETTLAKKLGVSRCTVMRQLKVLKAAGLVEIKRTQRGNRYQIPMSQNATSHVAKCDFPMSQNATPQAAGPLYEPYFLEGSGSRAATAAFSPSRKHALNTPAPPRKSATSETLRAYYRDERRKAER